jgi:hypothetical protein
MRLTRPRLAIASLTVAAAIGLSAGTAAADHAHFIVQPEHGAHPATCRYIAQGQTSKQGSLPGDTTDQGGHSFHDHVHTGQPGTDAHGTDFDKSANAGDYGDCDFVNQP